MIVSVHIHDGNLIVKVAPHVLSQRSEERIVMGDRKCVSENHYIHSITSNHMLVDLRFHILELFSQIIVKSSAISDCSAQQGESKVQGSFVDKEKVFRFYWMTLDLERVIPVLVKLMKIFSPEALGFHMIGTVIPFIVYGRRRLVQIRFWNSSLWENMVME